MTDSLTRTERKVREEHHREENAHHEAADVCEVVEVRCEADDDADNYHSDDNSESLWRVLVHSPRRDDVDEHDAEVAEDGACRTAGDDRRYEEAGQNVTKRRGNEVDEEGSPVARLLLERTGQECKDDDNEEVDDA